MNLVERAKNMILTPKSEWDVVNAETVSTVDLYKSYVVPLSAVGPIAMFIGGSLIGAGFSFLGASLLGGLSMALVHYVLGLIAVYLIALLINALAPTFGGTKNMAQALKVAVFSYTPAWVAGILHILPGLHLLVALASLYSLYLLYLGLPVLMKSPVDKTIGYAIAIVVCAFVLGAVFSTVAYEVGGYGMWSHRMMGYSSNSGDARVSIEGMRQFGASVDAANKQMAAAKQSGNVQPQMPAIAAVPLDTVDQNTLKGLLPETVGSLKRNKLEGEKTAVANFNFSKADAGYADDQGHSVELSITDAGGTPMFAGLTAWAMIEQDRETDTGYEKIGKVDGRPVHEKFNKNGMNGEYTVVVANRFVVSATGRQVDMDTLKQGIAAIGLDKLDGMKNVGVK